MYYLLAQAYKVTKSFQVSVLYIRHSWAISWYGTVCLAIISFVSTDKNSTYIRLGSSNLVHVFPMINGRSLLLVFQGQRQRLHLH